MAEPSGRTQRALVIGAQGVFGGLIVEALQRAGWEVRRGGRRPHLAPGIVPADLDQPETIATLIPDVDVVVNTVPDQQLTAERMVLESGGILINVSAMPVAAVRRLHNQPGPHRGTVVMNAGIAPGLTNLIAADLLAQHPSADRIDIVLTVSAKAAIGHAGRDFGYRGLTAVPRHAAIDVKLPEPFGRRRCIGFAEPERGWLGQIADGRTVNTYICVAERRVNAALVAVNRAGLIKRVPKVVLIGRPRRHVPGQPGNEPITHRVAASSQGRTLEARTLRCQGDYRTGAAITAVFSEALLDGAHERHPGVFDPDEILSLMRLEPQLQQAGVTVYTEQPDEQRSGSSDRPGASETRPGHRGQSIRP